MPAWVRRARPDDLGAVGALTLSAYLAEGHFTADDAYAATLTDAATRHRDAELWVADDGQGVVGTVTFALPGTAYAEISRVGEGEFRMLAVSPHARGRGVGEALVETCQRRAVEEGLTGLVLSTMPQMAAAHRLYERKGFVRTPERDWDPVPGVRLLTFAWRPLGPVERQPGGPVPVNRDGSPPDVG